MTQQTRSALKHLQRLDTRLAEARKRVRDFDPVFEEVEEPALLLESEVGTTRKRLQEMRLEERRLELASEEKRGRVSRLEERLGNVRNLREEAAVSAELDMIKRALQSDEQEAYTLIDQIRKLEERLAELEEGWELAREQVEPKKEALLAEREQVKQELASLEKEREEFAATLDPEELRMYEGIRSGGRRVAVAELTEDGACNNCFGMVPLQGQNEIRHGSALIRCEACGVILSAPDPEAPESEAPEAAADDEVEASGDAPGDDASGDDETGEERAEEEEATPAAEAAEADGGESAGEPQAAEDDGDGDGAATKVPLPAASLEAELAEAASVEANDEPDTEEVVDAG